MLKPIDMQIVVKNMDEGGRMARQNSPNLVAAQANAEGAVKNQVQKDLETINESNKSEGRGVEEDERKNQERRRRRIEFLKKRRNERREHRSKDPNRGRIVDLEG